MSDPDLKPPPIAAEIADALDADRLSFVGDTLALASRFAAAGSLAAEAGDIAELAIRSRQAIIALREATLVIGELGQAEATPPGGRFPTS
jgi:hypothetical protein